MSTTKLCITELFIDDAVGKQMFFDVAELLENRKWTALDEYIWTELGTSDRGVVVDVLYEYDRESYNKLFGASSKGNPFPSFR